MTETICWYAAFALGAAGFLLGIVYLLCRKGIREEHFATAAVFEFAASWILYIPEELFNDIPESVPGLRVLEGVLTALVRTLNIYLGNDYRRLTFAGHPVFSGLYSTLVALTNILLLLFVAGFIIRFFDGPLQRIALSLRRRRSTCIFSACNDKTLAIAASVPGERRNLVFAGSGKDLDSARKERIAALRGIRIPGGVPEVLERILPAAPRTEVFLFGDSEEDNLAALERTCLYLEAHPGASVKIYVELSETPWSLYDDYLRTHNSAGGEALVINFVRTEENFAYNNLLKNSIFENAIPRPGADSDIRFLLVGMNERNLEMLKAMLHLGQMPGYRLSVMVLDPAAGRAELRRRMPEIADECDRVGDAVYRLIYKENVPPESDALERIVGGEFADFTFAFVNVGDDLLNANVAMRLNALCYRSGRGDDYRIQTNLRDSAICDKWNPELLRHIETVGEVPSVFDYAFITMSAIERGTVAIHRARYPGGEPTWISYCNNEYNRHSVYARTLSFRHKVAIIDRHYGGNYAVTGEDRRWRVYEHMRWNVYTRTLGYVLADPAILPPDGSLDKHLRGIAKVHNDLVDFDALSEEEQNKDSLQLTDEIVAILKSLDD